MRNIRNTAENIGNEGPDPASSAGAGSALGGVLDLTGVFLDELALESLIGVGGMGEVWLARDLELEIRVAVKVLPPDLARDSHFLIHFLREARIVARLNHPNIVRVLRAGRRAYKGENLRVMVMEFVDGVTAAAALRNEGYRMGPRRAAGVALGVARALQYAHGKGVIHRDIKPANLIIPQAKGQTDDGQNVKVLDFGLATLADRVTRKGSADDSIVGTPRYMAPEQAQGLPVEGSADVYSLGVTLYELLAGKPPFEGESPYSVIRSHVEQPLPFYSADFKALPPMFVELIRGMCEKSAKARLPLQRVIATLEDFLQITPSVPDLPTTAAPVNTNLAATFGSFVGREAELSELSAQLRGGGLVTVTGPGGIGKTRLAHECAAELLGDFPGGVWFCDLTEARSEDGICHAVARSLGVPLTQGDPAARIRHMLRMREPMLLILDNFEQVAQYAAVTVGTWMKDAPQVTLLVTSREPLQLRAERAFPLDVLDAASGPDAPAVKLFCDRAQEARRQFKPDETNLPAIHRLVSELEGVPLAIELAAARVATLPVQKILERLPRRLDLLSRPSRDAGRRQATLRGTIDWSWDLLAPYEKLALAQCSVFRDGFFLEAAEAVLDLSMFPIAPMVMDVVEGLAQKGLLRAYEHDSVPGEARFRMFETIREYAADKLADPAAVKLFTGPESSFELQLRHARHYVQYAEDWNERIASDLGTEAVGRIALEIENLFAVQDSLEQRQPELTARAALACARTLAIRGLWPQRVPRLQRAVRAAPPESTTLRSRLHSALSEAHRECGTRDGMLEAAEQALALSGEDPSARAEALLVQGKNSVRGGEYERALTLLAEAERLFHGLGTLAREADAIGTSAIAHNRGDNHAAALACFERADALHRRLGDLRGIERNLANRGVMHFHRGEHDLALACFEEANELARQLDDNGMTATNIGNEGLVHFNRGDHEAALNCFTRAEEVHRELGNRVGIAMNTANRGLVYHTQGDLGRAMDCYFEAEQIQRELGHTEGVAIQVRNRGVALLAVSEFATALALFTEAETINREIKKRAGLAEALHSRAMCLIMLDRPPEALEVLREAAEIYRAIDHKTGLASVLLATARAEIAYAGGDALALVHSLRRARSAARQAAALLSDLGKDRSLLGFEAFATRARIKQLLALHLNESRTARPRTRSRCADLLAAAKQLATEADSISTELGLPNQPSDPLRRPVEQWVAELIATPE